MSATSRAARARWTAYVLRHAPFEGRVPFKPAAVIEQAQRRRLHETVVHAARHVPYYRETMRRLGLGVDDFRCSADLARLPLIEREQVQRDPEYFVSRAEPISRYVMLQSGGSTGRPLAVFHDVFALFQGAVHRERLRTVVMGLAGKRVRYRELRIVPPLSTAAITRRAFQRTALVSASVRTTTLHLSLLDPPDKNIQRLNEFRPDVLLGYGSYLEALFAWLRETSSPFQRPRVVVFTSDAMSETVRRIISEEFGIRVLGVYGAIEAFNIGFECEAHRGFHLNVDLYPLRVVEPGGRELADGESGEVVVSNLVSRGTMLLNYRLGDIAAKLPGTCSCGRSLPVLSFLEGRTDDWIATAAGQHVHPQSVRTLFTDEHEVWRYQTMQLSPSRFRIAVVADPECGRSALEARLVRKFTDRFGEQITVEVTFVSDLPRTAGGKVRAVVRGRPDA